MPAFGSFIQDVLILGKNEHQSGSAPYTYYVEVNGVRGTVPSYTNYNVGDTGKLYVYPFSNWRNLRLVVR